MGMYFSGHPFDDYKPHAKALGTISSIGDLLTEIEEDTGTFKDHDTVTVAGLVTARTNKQTRAGAPMAFVTIEDRFGELELVVFPKVLEKHTYFLSPDAPIAVVGELSVSEDSAPKLLVSDVAVLQADFSGEAEPLQKPRYPRAEPKKSEAPHSPTPAPTATQKPKTLYLKVSSMQSEECRRACSLLEIFEGPIPVVFYDASAKKYVKAIGRSTEILPNMLRLLKILLGEDGVVYK